MSTMKDFVKSLLKSETFYLQHFQNSLTLKTKCGSPLFNKNVLGFSPSGFFRALTMLVSIVTLTDRIFSIMYFARDPHF